MRERPRVITRRQARQYAIPPTGEAEPPGRNLERLDAPIYLAGPSHSEAPISIDVAADCSNSWEAHRAALIIAHPGHELRVHHWLERAKPLVLVLTDGSGHTDQSRLGRTTALIERAGAAPGRIYGALSDRALYRAILAGDADVFIALAQEIAHVLDHAGVDYVVGDAVEGANPGHDACRLIINAALMRIEATRGRRLGNFEFTLEGPPDACPPNDRDAAIILTLGEDAYRRKLEEAQSYSEMAIDLRRAMHSHQLEAFRTECLRPVRYGLEIGDCFEHPALYEGYGEQQVAAGFYTDVIRFRAHLAPLAERLGRAAAQVKPAGAP